MKIKNTFSSHHRVKTKLGLLLLIASLFTIGCSDQSSSNDTEKETTELNKKKKKQAIPVEVKAVSRGDIQQTYRTITTLEAEQDVQIVARSTGLLQKILVEEGDAVIKGQLMAQLDVELLALELAQLSATSKKLKKELERQQRLYKKKLSSTDTLDRAKFEYQSQLAQYKLSQLKLNYASIRSPIDGIVTERFVKQGNLIRNNDQLFNVVNLSSLKAVLYLPEKELSKVKKQQKILLQIDALGKQIITGEIERIRPVIDTQTGTFKVIAKIENKDHFLKSGMFGKVEIVFDVHRNSLIVEQQSVITQDNRSHVFVVTDNKAVQTPVSIGYQRNGMLEITQGLSEKDQVITTGQQILKHGSLVEIVLQEEQLVDQNKTDNPAQTSNVSLNLGAAH